MVKSYTALTQNMFKHLARGEEVQYGAFRVKTGDGKIIVRFAENPLALRGWTIIDGRGQQVSVALSDMQSGLQLADSLFKNDSGR